MKRLSCILLLFKTASSVSSRSGALSAAIVVDKLLFNSIDSVIVFAESTTNVTLCSTVSLNSYANRTVALSSKLVIISLVVFCLLILPSMYMSTVNEVAVSAPPAFLISSENVSELFASVMSVIGTFSSFVGIKSGRFGRTVTEEICLLLLSLDSLILFLGSISTTMVNVPETDGVHTADEVFELCPLTLVKFVKFREFNDVSLMRTVV